MAGWARVGLVLPLLLFGAAIRADWPQHRGNPQRTAYVEQPLLADRWELAWEFHELSAPQPAWPAPARGSLWQRLDQLEPRVTDDWGDVPILAADDAGQLQVLVGSSANDRLIAIDPVTGRRRWELVAGAPIRFAPTVSKGIAYFGSDDGRVRAVRVRNGLLLWEVSIGPELPWIVGNGRLISPHPVRTSVLESDDRIYACAGLFPSQGVYAVCLRSEDGGLLWRRRVDKSPQGYLLQADSRRLIVPEGRAAPFMLSIEDGRLLDSLPSPGGSFCMLTPEAFFAGPGNLPRVESFPLEAELRPQLEEDQPVMLPLEGRATAAGGGYIWVAGGGQLRCYEIAGILQRQESLVWSQPCRLDQALIVSGAADDPRLFVAGGSTIEVYHARDGGLLQSLELPDTEQQIVYLAVAESSSQPDSPTDCSVLVASTRSGRIYGWRGGQAEKIEPSDKKQAASTSEAVPSAAQDRAGEGSAARSTRGVEDLTLSEEVRQRATQILQSLPVETGLMLVLDDDSGELTAALAALSTYTLVAVVDTAEQAARLQRQWQRLGIYGHRACVRQVPADQPLPFADALFNAVVQSCETARSPAEILRVLAPESGRWWRPDQPAVARPSEAGDGSWRHQYGSPANEASSLDHRLAAAESFQLRWFGGVGPQPMPDRHLRGHPPLAAGAALVMHGDGTLIGVDPANGVQRWQIELPAQSMRFVMPYDGGYSCLTEDGRRLYTATAEAIWSMDALTGRRVGDRAVPSDWPQLRWGYLAEDQGRLFASLMKPSAPRLSIDSRPLTRQLYSDQDYNSRRPLVCSRGLLCLDPSGAVHWSYRGGVVINSTLAIGGNDQAATGHASRSPTDRPNESANQVASDGAVDSKASQSSRRLVLVEARSRDCREHPTDRIDLTLLMQSAWLVCLDAASGQPVWQQPLEWPEAENVLYTQIAEGCVVLVTSRSDEPRERASYSIRVYRLANGDLLWQHEHAHVRRGLYHGEQVHHPVVLRPPGEPALLVVEPYLYELASGRRRVPRDASGNWALRRPGHSCGSLSGCGHNLFFRATHPTVLNLRSDSGGGFTALAPSRPGCWINMIPAAGRLLIPEASASCVCHFPLQTSLAFAPLSESSPPLLPDVLGEFD